MHIKDISFPIQVYTSPNQFIDSGFYLFIYLMGLFNIGRTL